MDRSPLHTMRDRITAPKERAELDDVDITLLVELSRDARTPQRALAATLGMSSPAVADRIARLKSRGVIRGFRVDIDWEAIGYSTVAFLSIVAVSGEDLNSVIKQLETLRGVEEITSATGSTDLLVKIRARGFEDLRTILSENVWTIEGLQRTETAIAFVQVEPKDQAVLMLDFLRTTQN